MESRLKSYKKEVKVVNETLANQKTVLETQERIIRVNTETIVDNVTEIYNLRNSPPEVSQEMIENKVSEILEVQNTENYWQRELDKTQHQLVFKTPRKSHFVSQSCHRVMIICGFLSLSGLQNIST